MPDQQTEPVRRPALLTLAIADFGDVVFSHCMVDHDGGLTGVRPGTRVWVQAAEWDFADSPEADPTVYRRADLAGLTIESRRLDGDAEPWPGVRFPATMGHCPGHRSMLVRVAAAWVALAADAADLKRNLTPRIAAGVLVAGRDATLAALDRLAAVAAALGAVILPGHDPDVWAALPAALG